jgi:hypothetical protein
MLQQWGKEWVGDIFDFTVNGSFCFKVVSLTLTENKLQASFKLSVLGF